MSGFEWLTLIAVGAALTLIAVSWVRLRPWLQERLNQAGLTALQQHNFEQALHYFEQVISHDTMAFAARYNRALALMRLQRLPEARQGFDELLVDFPGYTRAMLGRAELFERMGDINAALADLERALQIDPTLVDVHLRRAQIYVAEGAPAQALEALRTAFAMAPGSRDVRVNLALLLVSSKDYSAAQRLLEPLLAEQSEPLLWLAQAEALAQQQQHQGAHEAYSKVLEAQPEHTQARLRRAFINLNLNAWAAARTDFEQVLEGDVESQSERVLATLGHSGAALMLGDVRAAAQDIELVLACDPGSADALRQRALLRFLDDDFDQALPDALAAIQLAPPNPLAAVMASRILRAQRRFEPAQTLLQETLELFGADEPSMLSEYALVLAAQHADPELYFPRLRAALSAHPDDAELLATLTWLQCLEQRPVLALPYAQRLTAQRSEGRWRDGRALALALLGRTEQALNDWTSVIVDLEHFDTPYHRRMVALRQEWIAALAAGAQPITPAVLAGLRLIV